MTESPKIHAKHVDIRVSGMVSVGTDDRQRSIEDFQRDVEAALRTVAGAKNVTLSRPYYILDGKVCLPEDYDPKTGTFKEGATPPSWAGGPSDQEIRAAAKHQELLHQDKAAEQAEKPARKPRSDKGKSRGPRTPPTEAAKVEVLDAADDLAEAMRRE